MVVPFPSASDFSVWPFGWPPSVSPVFQNATIKATSLVSTFKNTGRERFSEINFVAIPNLGSGPPLFSRHFSLPPSL